jgi:hypothetical protein
MRLNRRPAYGSQFRGTKLSLGPCDWLAVDFLAPLAYGAPAARMVSASSEGATVEPVLELLAVLRLPRLDWQAVLLLDP